MLRRFLPLLMLVACTDPATQQQVDGAVYSWMQCIDCLAHERERVVAYGDAAVPRLRAILLDGPPPAHITAVSAMMQHLAQTAPPGSAPTPAVIARQIESYRSMYRRRAISALTGIGGTQARAALCAGRGGAGTALPIQPAVDSALASVPGAPCP